MVNYNKLSPGVYLQRGDSIKAITTQMLPNGDFRTGIGSNATAEQLAASVTYVFTALEYRRDGMNEVANVSSWYRRDTEFPNTPQLGFDLFDELPRIDQGLQLHKAVYYHKTETRGNSFTLRWLDPASMMPDKDYIDSVTNQYTQYKRRVKGRFIRIPADELIVIDRKGMRELDGATTAGQATRLAGQILQSLDTTLDDFYDHNGLPMKIISVDAATSQEEITRLQEFFDRAVRRFRGRTNKTMGVRGGVTVENVSFAPEQLELSSTRSDLALAIFAAHGVPSSVLNDVNKAEATVKELKFMRRLVGRAQLIARRINNDPDIQRSQFYLQVNENRLEAYQNAKLQQAEALQRLSGRPVISLNEAREQLELDPVPNGDEIFLPNSFGMLPSPASEVPEATPTRSADWQDEMKLLDNFIANGTHYKRDFRSNLLSTADIWGRIAERDPKYINDLKFAKLQAGMYP